MIFQTEIEDLDRLNDTMKRYLPEGCPVFDRIQKERQRLQERQNRIREALEAVEDPEMKDILRWRFLHCLPWAEVYNRALPGLWSDNPAEYAKVKARRYLNKRPDLKEKLLQLAKDA